MSVDIAINNYHIWIKWCFPEVACNGLKELHLAFLLDLANIPLAHSSCQGIRSANNIYRLIGSTEPLKYMSKSLMLCSRLVAVNLEPKSLAAINDCRIKDYFVDLKHSLLVVVL